MVTRWILGRGGGGVDINNMDDFYNTDVDSVFRIESDLLDDSNSKLDPVIYLKVTSVLFVRAGVFLSQVSSIPSSNIQVLIFQNIIDIAVNTVIYSLVGYLFAFGKDFGSFVGVDGFLNDKSNRNEFAEGWLIIIAVSGLVVAAIGDRISFFASLIINTLISGLVFPLFIHWILSDSGWMRVYTFAKVKVSYKDYSYSCLIHMSGGFLAFLSMLVLNKRLLRFKDMDVCSVPDNGPSLTLFGNFFMIIGFFGIGVPTNTYILSHLNYNFYGIVLINTLLSAFASVTTTLLLTFSWPIEPLHKWTSMRSMQAGISGIAVIASGADVYYPMAALLIGLFNGFIFFLISFLVNISPIEDYSNLIACHFVSGFIGTLLPPIFGIREGFNNMSSFYKLIHVLWQMVCDLGILGMILVIFTPILFILDYTSLLRSWDEDINHRRALFASKNIKDHSNLKDNKKENPKLGYLDKSIAKSEKTASLEEKKDPEFERVDVLFEKKQNEEREAMETVSVVASVTNISRKFEFPVDKQVNYMIHAEPLTFFEEIRSDSNAITFEETGETIVKYNGEDIYKNSTFFDMRVVRGIRNISDSKLFQKLKDNWVVPQKRRWNSRRNREMRVGSGSNIWTPNSLRFYTETQV